MMALQRAWRYKRWLLGLSVTAVVAAVLFYLPARAQENRLGDGTTIAGQLDTPDAEDRWVFEAAAGDMVALTIEPKTEGFLPTLTITDPQGRLLMRVTYPSGHEGEFDFSLGVSHTGDHTVSVTGSAQTTGHYELGFFVLDHSTTSGDGRLLYGRSAQGVITDSVFRTFWTFAGNAGDVVDVFMIATGGDLDPFVALLTPEGTQLAAADGGGEGRDAALFAVRLPATGTYTVVARRAGANFGERGRTAGSYELLVSLRQAGGDQKLSAPLPLRSGAAVRGRLTRTAPVMRYRLIDTEGAVAFAVQVAEPGQGLEVTLYARDGVPLGTYTGFGYFTGSVPVPAGSDAELEIVPFGGLAMEAVDFRLSVTTLLTTAQGISRLSPGERREVPGGEDAVRLWLLAAEAGDMVLLHLVPYGPVADATARVTAPDGDVVLMRALSQEVRQPLVLQQNGLYEIAVDEAIATRGYAIQVDVQGKHGRAFAQIPRDQTAQPLPVNGAVGELSSGTADVWLFDADESRTWRFDLVQQTGTSPLIMQVEAPDGHVMGTVVTDPFLRDATFQPTLVARGRYRVRVFAVNGETARYTLRVAPGNGGPLSAGVPVKGVIRPDDSTHSWWLEASAGAVLTVDLRLLPDAEVPDVIVLNPNGLVVASSLQTESNRLNGVYLRDGGRYRVLVSRPGTSSRSVYYLTATLAASAGLVSAQPVEMLLRVAPTPVPPRSVPVADLLVPLQRQEVGATQSTARLQFGVPVRGEIPGGQFAQRWAFVAEAGQTFAFTAVPEPAGSHLTLALLDAAGAILAEQHNSGDDAATMTYSFMAGGDYWLAVGMKDARRYVLWAEEVNGFDPRAAQVIPGSVLSPGDTVRATLQPEAAEQRFLFWGQQADTVFVSVYPQQDVSLTLELRDLAGSRLAAGAPVSGGIGALSLQAALPADGVYQVVVAAGQSLLSEALLFDLHLNTVASALRQASTGGVLDGSVTDVLPTGGSAHWLFVGTAGQRVSATVELLDGEGTGPLVLSLADSGGAVFAQRRAYLNQRVVTLEGTILPRTGVYQVVVGGHGGRYRLNIAGNRIQQEAASLALNYGTTGTGLLTAADVLDAWTWSGSQGDVVGVTVRQTAGEPTLLTVQVRARDGRVLATAVAGPNQHARVEGLALPLDGHYTLLVGSPSARSEGLGYAVSIYLEATAAHSMGWAIAPGETWRGSLTVDDPVDTWLVEGSDGDTLTVTVDPHDQRLSAAISLIATDWHLGGFSEAPAVLAETQSVNGETARLTYTLSVPGPYAILVRAAPRSFGSYDLSVTREAQTLSSAQRLRPEQLRTGELGSPVLANFWQFEGQGGETVTLSASPSASATTLALRMVLLAPDSSPLAKAESGYGRTVAIPDYTLPVTGTYTVVISPVEGSPSGVAGHYTLLLQQARSTRSAPRSIQMGQTVLDALDANTPARWWTFTGQGGEVVRITTQATGGSLDPVAALYDSDGNLLASADDAQGLEATLTVTLPADGAYAIQVARYGGAFGQTTGNYLISLERVYSPATESIEAEMLFYGQRVAGTLDREKTEARWAFWGSAGDTIAVTAQFPEDDMPLLLAVTDPAGNTLMAGTRVGGTSTIEAFEVPAQGIYLITLRRPGDTRSSFSPYSVELEIVDWPMGLPTVPGVLSVGQPVTARMEPGQTHIWQFSGAAGQTVACLALSREGVLAASLALYGPDGRLVANVGPRQGENRALTTGAVVLPYEGVYSVALQPLSTVTSAVTYRLLLQASTMQRGLATPVTPGQNVFGLLSDFHPSDEWTLEVRRQETIFLRVSVLSGDLQPAVTLIDPAGRPVAQGVREQGTVGTEIVVGPLRVSEGGTYRVVVTREGGMGGPSSGRYRLAVHQARLSPEAAMAQALTFEVPVWGTLTDRETQTYLFSGLAGDLVAVSLLRIDGEATPHLTIETESGELISAQTVAGADELAIPGFVVPRSGRYVVRITADGPLGYGLYVARRTVEVPTERPVRLLGTGIRLVENIQEAGQVTRWRFSGQQGDVLTFQVTAISDRLIPDVALFGPQGYLGGATGLLSREVVLGPLRLPDTGEYVLVVRGWRNAAGGTVGQYSVLMERAPAGVSGSSGGIIPASGYAVHGGLIVSDPSDTWLFEGRAGETLAVQLEASKTNVPLEVALSAPDGTVLISQRSSLGLVASEGLLLPVDGTYTLRIFARLTAGLPVEYRLIVVAGENLLPDGDESTRGIQVGRAETGTLSPARPGETWVFFGQAGQNVAVTVKCLSPETGVALTVTLVDASGETLWVGRAAGASVRLGPLLLPQNGFYGVGVSMNPTSLSSVSEIAYEVLLDMPTPQALEMGDLQGQALAQLSDGVPAHEWRLRPKYTGTYRLVARSQSPGKELALAVLSQTGAVVARGSEDEQSGERRVATVRLDAGTFYRVVVADPSAEGAISYSLEVVPASHDSVGETIRSNEQEIGRIDNSHFADQWVVRGGGSQAVRIVVRPVSGTLVPTLQVYDAAGESLVSATAGEGGEIVAELRLPRDGMAYAVVGRAGGAGGASAGDYTITVQHAEG